MADASKEGVGRPSAPYPIEVRSAGVSAMPGFPASWEAVEVMARKGIDISAHISRPVEYEDNENADLVITMTEAHKSMLLFGYPEFATKIYTLSEMLGEFWGDVIDPFGQGLEAYARRIFLKIAFRFWPKDWPDWMSENEEQELFEKNGREGSCTGSYGAVQFWAAEAEARQRQVTDWARKH